MSRRRVVRGPRSALTSFLAEHGIDANDIRRRHQQRQAEETAETADDGAQPEQSEASSVGSSLASAATSPAGLPGSSGDTQADGAFVAATTVSATLTADGLGAIDVDVAIASSSLSTSWNVRKRAGSRSTRATVTQKKRKTAAKKKGKHSSSDEYNDDDESVPDPALKKSAARPGPHVTFCSKCRCRYTVTTPRLKSSLPEAGLCPACAVDGAKGETTPLVKRRRRKLASKLSKDLAVIEDKDKGRVASLRNICLAVIGDNIHDVEALGDLSQINRDKLSRIISRLRELTSDTSRLFLDAGETDVKLYDCTLLDEDGLSAIPMLAPNLTSLTLGFCGHLTPKVTEMIGACLPKLTRLDLSGAFLVKSRAWRGLLSNLPNLTSLCLAHTPGLNADAVGGLAAAPCLQELRLCDVSGVDDEALEVLAALLTSGSLRVLELARPANGSNNTVPITPSVLMRLITAVGHGLEEIQLTDCGTAVTDEVVVEGVARLCPRLVEVGISGSEGISSEALKLFFTVNLESASRIRTLEHDSRECRTGFQRIDFSRLGLPASPEKMGERLLQDEPEEDDDDEGDGHRARREGEGVDDGVLAALSCHSGRTLVELNISGADGLVYGLEALFDPKAPLGADENRPTFVVPPPPSGGDTSRTEAAASRNKVEAGDRDPALPALRILDVSWIRAVDDAALDRLAVEAPEIREVSVWGCHRVSDCAKVRTRSGFAKLIGREREPESAALQGR